MMLRQEILKEHSKAQCNAIVEWVGQSQKRFDELFNLFINDEYRVVQRAAWPVSYCVKKYPSFIKNHFEELIKKLQEPGVHDSVKRNSMRLLEAIQIPEKFQGSIMDIAFNYIASPTEATAIKAFSITVLGNMAIQYPEIIPELKTIIEEQFEKEKPAFKSRAKRLFKELTIA